MLRIVPHTLPRVGRSYEHFPDGFELHLLLQDGNTSLHKAATSGCATVVETLLAAGADIEAKGEVRGVPGHDHEMVSPGHDMVCNLYIA